MSGHWPAPLAGAETFRRTCPSVTPVAGPNTSQRWASISPVRACGPDLRAADTSHPDVQQSWSSSQVPMPSGRAPSRYIPAATPGGLAPATTRTPEGRVRSPTDLPGTTASIAPCRAACGSEPSGRACAETVGDKCGSVDACGNVQITLGRSKPRNDRAKHDTAALNRSGSFHRTRNGDR